MKNIKSYIVGIAAIGAVAFTGCNMDVDPVPVNIPEATMTPNTTLLELKTKFWDDATNYIWGTENTPDAIPATIPAREDGSHYIIHGRVISNDDAGNVFKSLVIQDETCALSFSINTYDLHVNYRVGQEIVVDATGMQIGKYNGLLQMGQAEWYENGSVWEASFMSLEAFRSHIELNGLPDVAKVDTIEVNTFSELTGDPAGLRKWQSQLVKFNNVYFQDGGKELFSEYQSSGVSRNIIDSEGASFPVRTSGYSDFWNMTLPEGNGDLVCIVGYYGTTGWQLTLIDYQGCMNFGNPTIAPGGTDNPYTVAQAIEAESNGRTPTGWVTGYIVGTVAPEVTEINSSDDIEWTAEATLANTLVIGPDPDCKDVAKCLVMLLPQDSKLREYAALRDNPDVYKRQIWVYGTLDSYMGNWGITGNNGTTDLFRIDGVDTSGDPKTIYSSLSEESQTLPDGWTIDNIDLGSFKEIWKWELYNGKGYLKATAFTSQLAATEAYAISPVIDLSGATSPSLTFDHAARFQTTLKTLCGVYARVEGTADWTKLAIPTWPTAGAWTFANSGNVDLSGFAGKKIQIAFKYASSTSGADTWEIKNLKVLASGGGQGGEVVDPDPPTPPITGDEVTVLSTQLVNIPGITTVNGFSFDIEKSGGTTNPNLFTDGNVRLYADNTMKVSGQRMTRITFTLASTVSKRYTEMSCSTGAITPAQASNDKTFTWVGDATEVTFTVGHDATLGSDGPDKRGQIHFSKLEITPAE